MNSTRRRGMSLAFGIISMPVMLGTAAFAVDVARLMVCRNEMRRAADAGALAGAQALLDMPAYTQSEGVKFASLNKVDEKLVASNSVDIVIGSYVRKTKLFTPATTAEQKKLANAVLCRVHKSKARGGAVATVLGSAIGMQTRDMVVESIAARINDLDVDQDVMGTSNPFLAGMPVGTVASENNWHNNADYAGNPNSTNPADWKSSPQIVSMPLNAGDKLTFDEISGTVRHDPNLDYYSPDGELTDIGHNINGKLDAKDNSYRNENGISDMKAPINALVGVFLSDSAPKNSKYANPANLDFSSTASRDFETLQPKVQQMFFIGDGLKSDGTRQEFVVPAGATRLVLATWDFYEWNNNAGQRNVKISRPGRVALVK